MAAELKIQTSGHDSGRRCLMTRGFCSNLVAEKGFRVVEAGGNRAVSNT